MADFMTSLWESVFTPGPTPALLIATNASFGCLQVLLLVLLVFTKSIHFLVLSALSGGLWYAINWFAAEVAAIKAKEAAEEKSKDKPRQTSLEIAGSDTETEEVDGAGGKTTAAEIATASGGKRRTTGNKPKPTSRRAAPAQAAVPAPTSGAGAAGAIAPSRTQPPATTDMPPPPQPGAVPSPPSNITAGSSPDMLEPRTAGTTTSRPPSQPMSGSGLLGRRGSGSMGDSSGYVSTDSEWEKISEGDGR